jgi:hypothetical protein
MPPDSQRESLSALFRGAGVGESGEGGRRAAGTRCRIVACVARPAGRPMVSLRVRSAAAMRLHISTKPLRHFDLIIGGSRWSIDLLR